jgi:hypothetical protein
MPFIVRDPEGNIAGVYNQAVEGGEEVSADDPGLVAFLKETAPGAAPEGDWVNSDLALARVMEDLVDVLIEKNIINFTDFPEGAQQKLMARRGMRKEFAYVADLFGAPEDGADGGGGEGEDFL